MNEPPSIRLIAKKSGFSTWSVSRALNGNHGVNTATGKKIRKIAETLGYKPNPIVSAVMSRNRSSRNRVGYNGNLAIVSAYREDKKPLPFHEEIIRAAQQRATELSFHVDQFLVGHDGLTVPRLGKILLARGIHGILDLPWNEPRDMSGIDWRAFSAVRMVYSWGSPSLNVVTPDYHQHFLYALMHLKQMGYRRIGLYLYTIHDDRILFKWRAAFGLFNLGVAPDSVVPVLVQDNKEAKPFLDWMERFDVDLVVSYSHKPLDWMREAGYKVPEERGFFSLNIHAGKSACAGLDLNPGLIGAIATETLAAQIHRNDRGYPLEPIHVAVPGKFHSGATIRMQPDIDPKGIRNTAEALFWQCHEDLRVHQFCPELQPK
jgi:DNA-binding LacI/PurR family transcriptional regulator